MDKMANRNMISVLAPIFIGLVFAAILGAAIYHGVRQWREWRTNNAQPIQTVTAKVIAKRTETVAPPKDMNPKVAYAKSVTRFATFQPDNGALVEFRVRVEEYDRLTEARSGLLRFQGTRFLGFEEKP